MAACTIDIDKEQDLKKLGVDDSKKLSPQVREQLFMKIIALCDYEIEVLSPTTIDAALHNPNMNLNKLEAMTTARLINKLECKKAIIDCPAKDTKGYADFIKSKLDNQDIEVIAEHKADENYPVVSAASILAKVTRDKEVEKIKEEIGVDIGSGYPADPKTQAFLKDNFEKHDGIFRTTWQTYKDLVNKKNQKSLFDY